MGEGIPLKAYQTVLQDEYENKKKKEAARIAAENEKRFQEGRILSIHVVVRLKSVFITKRKKKSDGL